MNHKLNAVTLSQVLKIQIAKGGSSLNKKAVIALCAELEQLGFKLSKDALSKVKSLSNEQLKELHSFLTSTLQKMTGSYVEHRPLFWNFPEEVEKINLYKQSRMQSFFRNNFVFEKEAEGLKSLSCGCVVDSDLFDVSLYGACPVCQMQNDITSQNSVEKIPLEDRVKLKTIHAISEEEAWIVVKNLINAKSSLSQKAKEDLEIIFKAYPSEVLDLLPETFNFKENMAVVANLMMKTQVYADAKVESWTKTATDVLRIAVAFSGGDVSLATKAKFKMSSIERKLVLSLLNKLATPQEDMLRHRQRWLRLGEYLHVGAYKSKYPQAFNAMQAIRENEKAIYTFNRHSEKVISNLKKSKNPKEALELFGKRPGEFARKLDLLMRSSTGVEVAEAFNQAAAHVATPLLLKLSKSIKTRTSKSEYRSFTPKSDMGKLYVLEQDTRETLSEEQIDKALLAIEGALKYRFSQKPALKKVFIDPALKKIMVPFQQRSASKTLQTIERGSRIKFDNKAETIRAFLYWKESAETGRIDVDLSAIGYDQNWNYKNHLSWTNLGDLDSAHSGDIQSAPNGASEFIDINLKSFLNTGIRYVAVTVRSFTGQAFKNFECFAGVMERQSPKSGEIFEASTVKNKFDLSGETTGNIPMILDLKTKEIIWCDLSMDMGRGRSVESDRKTMPRLAKTIVAMEQTHPSLFDLISLHVSARGGEVHTKLDKDETYDFVFDQDKAKDIGDILANWI